MKSKYFIYFQQIKNMIRQNINYHCNEIFDSTAIKTKKMEKSYPFLTDQVGKNFF